MYLIVYVVSLFVLYFVTIIMCAKKELGEENK